MIGKIFDMKLLFLLSAYLILISAAPKWIYVDDTQQDTYHIQKDPGFNSGIKVPGAMIGIFEKLKAEKLEFVIVTIDIQNRKTGRLVMKEEMEVGGSARVLEEEGIDISSLDVNPSWYLFQKRMKELSVAYGACYFHYTWNGKPESKLVLVKLISDDANVNERMFYSSTFDEVKKKMDANKAIDVRNVNDLSFKKMKPRMMG